MAVHYESAMTTKCRLVTLKPTRKSAIGRHPLVSSYDSLNEQFFRTSRCRATDAIHFNQKQHSKANGTAVSIFFESTGMEKQRKFLAHHLTIKSHGLTARSPVDDFNYEHQLARWCSGESVRIAVGRPGVHSLGRVIPKDFKK